MSSKKVVDEVALKTDAELRLRIRELEDALADVSQRKESLKAGYKETFDLAGVGIAHVSITGQFLDVNARFCEMTGMTREELSRATFKDITYEPDLARNLAKFDALMRGEIPGYRLEKRYRRPNGELFWVDLTVSAHLGPDGKPLKLISIISDITEWKAAEERQEFLLGELSHRTKNLLTVVQAIVSQTAAKTNSVDELKTMIADRLSSMAASQNALIASDGRQATVGELVAAQLAIVLAPGDPRISVEGPEILLGANATRVIGMALHELTTNACKYGALSMATGKLQVAWSVEEDEPGRFSFSWIERDGPEVQQPTRVGFGRRVIERMVVNSTNGAVELKFDPEGVAWLFSAPLNGIAPQSETAPKH